MHSYKCICTHYPKDRNDETNMVGWINNKMPGYDADLLDWIRSDRTAQ